MKYLNYLSIVFTLFYIVNNKDLTIKIDSLKLVWLSLMLNCTDQIKKFNQIFNELDQYV